MTNLKLKASWGKTGMKDIGPYRYMEMFSFSSQYDGEPAAVPTQMANPDLTWEQTDQMNAGLELGLFKRIDLEVNFYRNMTKDLLVESALPPSGGFRTQWQNIGKDLNRVLKSAFHATWLNPVISTGQWISHLAITRISFQILEVIPLLHPITMALCRFTITEHHFIHGMPRNFTVLTRQWIHALG